MSKQRVRISSKQTRKIELSDGSYVLIRGMLDYNSFNVFMKAITGDIKEDGDKKKKKKSPEDQIKEMSVEQEVELSIQFLKEIIVGWNFVDEDDVVIDFDADLIEEFDIETINEIMFPAIELYKGEKKSLTSSERTSSTTKKEKARG